METEDVTKEEIYSSNWDGDEDDDWDDDDSDCW